MEVFDTTGTPYALNETSCRGGEGRMYSVDGRSDLLAKVFKPEKRSRGREAKIRQWEEWLRNGTASESFLNHVVIPQRCLYSSAYDQNSRTFVGYLMEKLSDFCNLHDIYKDPHITYLQKVWAARNLCILTHAVHSLGPDIVIGDYNANNIAVFPRTSTAKLIDVDSFQVTVHRNGTTIFCPCTVGVPEFMAPEICRRLRREKTNLEEIDQGPDNAIFTIYTDYYSLACHVFGLLMNGYSPFSSMLDMKELAGHPSKTVSDVDIDVCRAAEAGDFVYGHKIMFRKPHDHAPNYRMLTPKLRNLFERAFVAGAKDPKKRPDAAELYTAVDEYLRTLEKRDCGHYMPASYKGSCEWCRIEELEKESSS